MIDIDNAVVTQIVEAARKHFLRFGYSRVSTEEIARSIGRSKKTLYKHFATKEALLHAVLARLDGEARREITALQTEGGLDRLARLRAVLISVSIHLASTHQVLLTDLRTSTPELGDLVWRERRQALGVLLAPVLREAVEERVIRADLPADNVLAILFACVEGMASPLEAPANAPPAEEPVSTLVSLLVDGLRAR